VIDVSVRTYGLAAIILLLLSIPNAFGITAFPGDRWTETVICTNNSDKWDTIAVAWKSGFPLVVEKVSGPTMKDLAPGDSFTVVFSIEVPIDLPPGDYTTTFYCESRRLGAPRSRYMREVHVPEPEPELPEPVGPHICIIATATYGSELSPEVQLLRNFRDRDVLSTFAGSQFMDVFDSFYYSFSPQMASLIASNALLRQFMQIFLRPLLAILLLAHHVYLRLYQLDSEAAIMLSGLIASTLLGLVYLSPVPALLAWRSLTIRRMFSSSRIMRVRIMLLSCLIGTVILGVLIRSPVLASLSTFATSAVLIVYAALLPTLLWLKIKHP